MNIPPGLLCASCRLPFRGAVARRTYAGFVHATACASRTELVDGAWIQKRGVMVWQPEGCAA